MPLGQDDNKKTEESKNVEKPQELSFEEIHENVRKRDKAYADALLNIHKQADEISKKKKSGLSTLEKKWSHGSNYRTIKQNSLYDNLRNFYNNYFQGNGAFLNELKKAAEDYTKNASPDEAKNKNVYNTLYELIGYRRSAFDSAINKSAFSANKLTELTDSLLDDLNKCFFYKSSENNKLFMNFYKSLLEINCEIKDLAEGRLFVPEKGAILNGKQTHHISNSKYDTAAKKYKDVQPGPPKSYSDKSKFEEDVVSFYNTPLFEYEPTPEDIEQGPLGDCYFLSALQSIVSQDPDKIKDMIREESDGIHVTVRFFNEKHEPVYVTVDKSYPVYEKKSGDKRYAMCGGAKWVAVMEKAYAVSGLHRNINKYSDAESEKFYGSYGDIEAGWEEMTVETLLGSDSKYCSVHREYIDPPSMKSSGPYSKKEEECFNKIANAFKDHKIITTSLNHYILSQLPGYDNYLNKNYSLTNMHAYSVIGTEVDTATNKKYIRVRNPHGGDTLGYDDNGKLKAFKTDADEKANQPVHPGESLLEIRDYFRFFDGTCITTYDFTPAQRYAQADADIVRENYEQAAKTFAQAIIDQDTWLLRSTGKNSPQYTQLRESAIKLVGVINNRYSDANNICDAMQRFFDKSVAYKDYCQTNPDKIKNMNERASKRYLINNAILGLKKAFDKNNTVPVYDQRKVKYDDIVKESLELQTGYREVNGIEIRDQILDPMQKQAIETLTQAKVMDRIKEKMETEGKTNEVKIAKNGMLMV